MTKVENIINLLNQVKEERIRQIESEIQQKESWVTDIAIKGSRFDTTHTEMVLDFIRDNKTPKRPETLNKLMIQLISSAFSYNRIRRQLRKINREKFSIDNYPIREDHEKILAYLLDEERFKIEDFWHPQKLELLIRDVETEGRYKDYKIISDYWLEHIMQILRTAPAKMIEISNENIAEFYKKVDDVCDKDYQQNVFRKSQNLWELTIEFSNGIRNVGSNLICDFLKESGFTQYAKMDVHLIRSMSEVINRNTCHELSDFESFIVTQWLADNIKMTPFKLDKILYVYGVYN